MMVRRLNNNALNEVVSTLLTLFIVLGVVASVLFWGLPYIEEKEIRSEFQAVFGGFDVMYDALSGIILDGYGSKGFSKLVATNDLASLNVDENGSKVVLSYSFDENPDYHFDVTGLDDGDDSFNIESDSTDFDLDKIQIYWLDPSVAPKTTVESPPYKKIYKTDTEDQYCAQPFISPESACKLDKVKIYVKKRGAMSTNLEVSIYEEIGSSPDVYPDVDHPIDTEVIPYADVPTSFDWVECDFEDFDLTENTVYYIGVNTSGGGSESGGYNYYQWYVDRNTPYDTEDYHANYTEDGTTWNTKVDYDFQYRVNFSGASASAAPSTPEINYEGSETEDNYPNFVSGTECSVDIKAEDADGDNVKLRIFWGDGNISPWQTAASDTEKNFKYTYAKPGNYTITLQAKDIYDTIFNPDNDTIDLGVAVGDYIPDDIWRQDTLYPYVEGTGPHTITTTGNVRLNGTLRLDLFASGGYNDVPFGRIWVFDVGSIYYVSPHTIGTQMTVFENGAILTHGPVNQNILSSPSFFEEDDAIGFRIIQIGEESSVTNVSGKGVYEINQYMKNSYSREPRFEKIYSFRLQFYNTLSFLESLWINYFTKFYDFETIAGKPNTILYEHDGKPFVLDSSYVGIDVFGGGV